MQIEIPGYSIVSTLSEGVAATVYLALDKHPRRELALKVIPLESCQFASQVQVLARDRVRMQRLVHPNIVRLLDSGIHAGHYFLAMEYLPGFTLSHKRFELDLLARLRVIIDVAKALDFIAEQGYVHGRIAPENILIHAQDGRAVLLGFGLHQVLDNNASRASSFHVDIPSPSLEHHRSDTPDSHSDLYSLGLLFFLLLTDHLPFPASSTALTDAEDVAPDIPRLPEHLLSFQPLLDRLLHAQPAVRYQRARDFVTDLGALSESSVRIAVAGFELSLLQDSESPLQLMARAAVDAGAKAAAKTVSSQTSQGKQAEHVAFDTDDEVASAREFFIDKDLFHSAEDIRIASERIVESSGARSHGNFPLLVMAVIGLMIPIAIYVAGKRSNENISTETAPAIAELDVSAAAAKPLGTAIETSPKIFYSVEPDLAQQAAGLRARLEEDFALATDLMVIYRAALRGEDPAEHAFAQAGLAELQQLFSDRIRMHLAARNVEAAESDRDLALWLFEPEERLPALNEALASVK